MSDHADLTAIVLESEPMQSSGAPSISPSLEHRLGFTRDAIPSSLLPHIEVFDASSTLDGEACSAVPLDLFARQNARSIDETYEVDTMTMQIKPAHDTKPSKIRFSGTLQDLDKCFPERSQGRFFFDYESNYYQESTECAFQEQMEFCYLISKASIAYYHRSNTNSILLDFTHTVSDSYVMREDDDLIFFSRRISEMDRFAQSCRKYPLTGRMSALADKAEGANFCCPISHLAFKVPVVAEDGNTYDKRSIEFWFQRGNGRSPLTNETIGTSLVPNRFVWKLMCDAVEKEEEEREAEQDVPRLVDAVSVEQDEAKENVGPRITLPVWRRSKRYRAEEVDPSSAPRFSSLV